MAALPQHQLDPDDVLLGEAYEEFVWSRRNRSPHTRQFYHFVLEVQFLPWCRPAGVEAPDQLTTRLVADYLDGCRARGLQPGGVRAQQRAIKALVNFWREPDHFDDGKPWIPADVRIRFERLAQPEQRPPMLEVEEIRRLLAKCETRRETALLHVLFDTGMRRAEVCKLDWSDVDLQSGVVLVRQGKRLKDRVVRLGPQSLRALRRHRREVRHQDGDPVFVSERGGARLTGSGLRGILVRLAKRAGVRTTAHMLCRSYATMYLRGGGQVVHLQRILGHAQIGTTVEYLRMDDADVLNAAAEHSPVEGSLK